MNRIAPGEVSDKQLEETFFANSSLNFKKSINFGLL